jgi:hypothetical protein
MLAGLDFGDAVRPYPLFAKELPRKTYAIKADTDPADLFAGSIPDNMFTGRGVAG